MTPITFILSTSLELIFLQFFNKKRDKKKDFATEFNLTDPKY